MTEKTRTLVQVRDWHLSKAAYYHDEQYTRMEQNHRRMADAIDAHLSRSVSVSSEDRKTFEKYAARMSLDIRHWEGGYMFFQTQKAWEVWFAALEADRAGRGVVVPDAMDFPTDVHSPTFIHQYNMTAGWNACREAMLAKTQPGAEGNGNG